MLPYLVFPAGPNQGLLVHALIEHMPLYWLCYRHNDQIFVVIEPGASPIHARMRTALANLDQGTFTEGHELDRKTEKQVPKAMIGRRLSQEEAKRLLAKLKHQ
jgi:hypothetical protein